MIGPRPRLGALVLAAAMATATGAADAQPPSDRQGQLAAGDRAAEDGRWEEALASYRKAHAAEPTAASARRVADALYELGRAVEAHEAYAALLEEHGSTLFPAVAREAKERKDELAGRIGSLSIRAGEAGAEVSVDGEPVGTTPLRPLRLAEGEHEIVVRKAGFETVRRTIDLKGGGSSRLDVVLEKAAAGATLRVEAAGDATMTVTIDGKAVGKTPYEGAVAPGTHVIAGVTATGETVPVTVDVDEGESKSVELEPPGSGKLEVRIEGEKGVVHVDGERVGEGGYAGVLSAGPHTLRVTREGYRPFEKEIAIDSGDVHVETVTLRKATAGQLDESEEDRGFSFDGLYGGVRLAGMFEPAGSGHSMDRDRSCEAIGATSCDGGVPMGGALGLYIGYAFAPVGLELLALGAGDVVEPTASFDGATGREINPLVATPAREESFIIGRYGGGGAVRARLLWPIGRFRVSGAVGAGLAYRRMRIGRDTVAADGATSSVAPEGDDYLSAALSLELSGQMLLGGSTHLALGLGLWLEHAAADTASTPEAGTFLQGGDGPPQPQATPAYDLATSTQLFLTPFLGLHFGP